MQMVTDHFIPGRDICMGGTSLAGGVTEKRNVITLQINLTSNKQSA